LGHTGADGGIEAFSSRDGRQLWNAAIGEPFIKAPSLADGRIGTYLVLPGGSGGVHYRVAVVQAAEGKLLWQRDFSGFVEQPPQMEGDVIYVPSDDELLAFSVSDGMLLWRHQVVLRQ